MFIISNDFQEINREVLTKYGRVRGAWGNDQTITVFRGIPYAQPPVGKLRWRAPMAPQPWEGVRDCLEFSKRCWQPDWSDPNDMYKKEFYANRVKNSEDCLYLNIWTPCAESGKNYPVILWIHGGGLHGGYGFEPEFDGEAFCRNGVILVTINYRLGILGFYGNSMLCQENDQRICGNYGYLDQIAALKWVRENIYNFGGDPNNITVMGQSAGAGSIMALITSRLTEGDIAKAILQSGIFLFSFGQALPSVCDMGALAQMGDEYMQAAGCQTVDELRALSYEELMKVPGMGFGGRFAFSPCIDHYVLSEDPAKAVLGGRFHNIPYLIGSNLNEDDVGYRPINTLEEFRNTAQDCFGTQAKAFLEMSDVKSQEDIAQALKDMGHFKLGVLLFSKVQTQSGRIPAYVYHFRRQLPGGGGAFHSSELWYVFKSLNRCWRPMTGLDYDIAEKMSAYWSEFSRTGNPNSAGFALWEPFTKDYYREMIFDVDTRPEKINLNKYQKFIMDFFEKSNKV